MGKPINDKAFIFVSSPLVSRSMCIGQALNLNPGQVVKGIGDRAVDYLERTVYSSLSFSLSSIKASLIVSGIRSLTSHLAIVLGSTDSLLANSTWLKRQLFRPSFNSDPVMP